MVKIEKGVPPPPKRVAMKDVLQSMEVGDSFLVPDEWAVNSLRCIAGFFPGMFSIKRVEGGHRCWRIK